MNMEKVLKIMQSNPERSRLGQQLAENIVLDGTYDQILSDHGEEAAAIVEEWLNIQNVYFDDALPSTEELLPTPQVADPEPAFQAGSQGSIWQQIKIAIKKINAINLKEIAQSETTVFIYEDLKTIIKTRHETRQWQNAGRQSPANRKKPPANGPP